MIAIEATALSRRAFLSASGALVVALAAPAEFAGRLPLRGLFGGDAQGSYRRLR